MRLRYILACLLISIGSAPSSALLAPEYYRQARAEAPYHLQVAITRVLPPASGPGSCHVEGTVVQVFKDASGKLRRDAAIGFPIACARRGDDIPDGGVIWTDTDAMLRATFIEVYLVDTERGLETARSQSRIITAPSEKPQRPID